MVTFRLYIVTQRVQRYVNSSKIESKSWAGFDLDLGGGGYTEPIAYCGIQIYNPWHRNVLFKLQKRIQHWWIVNNIIPFEMHQIKGHQTNDPRKPAIFHLSWKVQQNLKERTTEPPLFDRSKSLIMKALTWVVRKQ